MTGQTVVDQAMPDRAVRRELGAFLRAVREHTDPDRLSLPRAPRRRTPGLRRQDVATLSGVGVSWYTWLEQGRVRASRQVLDAIGRALRLDEVEHRHLLELAGYHPARPEPGTSPGEVVTGRLQALLDGWTGTPAAVLDDRLDVLARNAAWTALWRSGSPGDHNLLYWLLTDPVAAALLPDHEPLAQDLFRHLRAAADRAPDDARLRAVLDRLALDRPDLAHWWRCRRVGDFPGRTVTVDHPVHGPFRQSWTMLRPTGQPGLTVLTQTTVSRPGPG